MKHTEKTIASRCIHDGRIIRVYDDTVVLENGKEAKREWVAHNGGVTVLALDDKDNLFLVRQFRYPYGKEILELPAGKREVDEEPLTTARRELEEECGLVAESWRFLGEMYPTPGYCGEIIYLFFAEHLTPTATCPDEDEFLDVISMPFEEALEKVRSGEICDAKTAVAIMKIALERK